MATATISRKDRDRMADDLRRLGLHATASLVRTGNISLTHGVEHVRLYVLSDVLRMARSQEAYEAEHPPTPGTFGAICLTRIRKRRDDLQRFLDEWATYDFAAANREAA